tara:strand:- start:195 stop:332 length:138 start_codon:yes stop_codon:yes gene_type:complete
VAESPEQLAQQITLRYGDLIDEWKCTWITKDDVATSHRLDKLTTR